MTGHDVVTPPIPRLELLIGEGSARLAERLDEAVALRPTEVIVDVAGCETLGATAIALLVDAHRRIRRYGGRMWLRGARPRVRRLLGLSGVEHVLDLLPSLDAGRPGP